MKIGVRQRWTILTVLLILTIGAATWVREGSKAADAELVESPARQVRTTVAAALPQDQPVDRIRLERMRARAGTGETGDAFAAHSWGKVAAKTRAPVTAPVIVTPPPPQVAAPVPPLPAPIPPAPSLPPPPPPPPPPPIAPPLPFVYMGKILSEEANAVFLTMGDRNLIVHEGDVIDATYRVDKLSSAGLTFTHIPTGIEQYLKAGGRQ